MLYYVKHKKPTEEGKKDKKWKNLFTKCEHSDIIPMLIKDIKILWRGVKHEKKFSTKSNVIFSSNNYNNNIITKFFTC